MAYGYGYGIGLPVMVDDLSQGWVKDLHISLSFYKAY